MVARVTRAGSLAAVVLLTATSALPCQDRPLDWRFTERLRLGSILGAETEAFHNLTPHSVAADEHGTLYVVDRGNHRVQVFDSTGTFIRSIGHEGNGPGEFRNPVSIWTRDDGTISVFDWAPHRVSVFTDEGDLVEDRSVPFARGMLMYTDSLRELFTVTEGLRTDSLGQSPDSTVELLLHVASGDTARLGRLSLVPPRMVQFYEPCRFGIGITPLFRPSIVWDVAAGRIAVTDSYEYRIDVHDFDGATFEITRALEPRRLAREDALERIGDPPRMPNPYGADCGRFDADVILETRGWYPFEQIIERIQIAPDGAVWVSRSVAPADDPVTDIFDPAGRYVGTLPPDAPFPDAFTPEGDIIVIEQGEFDVEQVVVYAIGR